MQRKKVGSESRSRYSSVDFECRENNVGERA